MTSQHHVSELDNINGTKSRPKLRPKSRPDSGPSWDHVGTKSGSSRDQVISKPSTQSPTQLHKIHLSLNSIKSVTKQVGEHVTEQVPATNHRGHRDLAAEVESTAKVIAYPGACKT